MMCANMLLNASPAKTLKSLGLSFTSFFFFLYFDFPQHIYKHERKEGFKLQKEFVQGQRLRNGWNGMANGEMVVQWLVGTPHHTLRRSDPFLGRAGERRTNSFTWGALSNSVHRQLLRQAD